MTMVHKAAFSAQNESTHEPDGRTRAWRSEANQSSCNKAIIMYSRRNNYLNHACMVSSGCSQNPSQFYNVVANCIISLTVNTLARWYTVLEWTGSVVPTLACNKQYTFFLDVIILHDGLDCCSSCTIDKGHISYNTIQQHLDKFLKRQRHLMTTCCVSP